MNRPSLKKLQDLAPALRPYAERAYVELMMQVIARGLVATSQEDEPVRREIATFPPGYTFQMQVVPAGPSFTVEVQAGGRLRLLPGFTGKPTLGVRFKHISHAFLVFSFQEGTARAFANDRMFVDGDVSHAIRMVRCLSRMEALILPRLVAERAVKRYPELPVRAKLDTAARIYRRLATNLLTGIPA